MGLSNMIRFTWRRDHRFLIKMSKDGLKDERSDS